MGISCIPTFSNVVLPAEKWDDWRAVNERISLQAASLPVEGFLDQVPSPTEEQLRKLYDEFKDVEPNMIYDVGGRELPSPNPGFAEPRRVKLQYLVGTVADRTKKLLDTVTQEEIADYYERNKRKEFVKSGLGDDAASFDNDAPESGAPVGDVECMRPPAKFRHRNACGRRCDGRTASRGCGLRRRPVAPLATPPAPTEPAACRVKMANSRRSCCAARRPLDRIATARPKTLWRRCSCPDETTAFPAEPHARS
jgi:hypothetical protein